MLDVLISLEREYRFSLDALLALSKVLDIRELALYLEAVREPGSLYYLRVNTLKASREEVISILGEEGVAAHPSKILEDAVYVKVSGPFRIKPVGKSVYADKAAAESVYLGANLYAPGVKKAPKVRCGDLVTVYDPLGEPVAVGVAEMDGDEMETRDTGLAVRVVRSVYKVPSVRETEAFRRGLVYDQSLPAMLSVVALSPEPGWLVVDLCAAPGGKATYAAQLMKDEGRVIAVDRSPAKVKRMEENIARMGLRSVKTLVADSRYLDLMSIVDQADAVIVDPPCTALGVRPKLYYEKRWHELVATQLYQRQFLRVAARIVKRGGRVLYSTCTVTWDENEGVILWAKRLGLSPVPHRPFIGTCSLAYSQRFYPHIHDQPGFFIAILEKNRR